MFAKDLNIGYLLDFYGELLTERKRSVMEMYFNEDFSLAEIAEEINISRQGVRDIIKKSEEELRFYEEKLGLAARFEKISGGLSEMKKIVGDLPRDEKKAELIKLIDSISENV